jgi:hypothetical protein
MCHGIVDEQQIGVAVGDETSLSTALKPAAVIRVSRSTSPIDGRVIAHLLGTRSLAVGPTERPAAADATVRSIHETTCFL